MTEGFPQIARVEPGEVTPALVTALYTGAVVSRVEAGVVALTGPGAVTSLQGLLTNDVELPGDGSFVYGALLTPKGMIVVDGWAARLGATMSYTVPAVGEGREHALAIFTRSVPPRLARVIDRSADVAVYRLAGPSTLAVAVAAGLAVPPAAGRVVLTPEGVAVFWPAAGVPWLSAKMSWILAPFRPGRPPPLASGMILASSALPLLITSAPTSMAILE